jgi:A/G-specific adenine glycosylase
MPPSGYRDRLYRPEHYRPRLGHDSGFGLTLDTESIGRVSASVSETLYAAVWQHHRRHRRDLPWRRTHDPYHILVSEIMLQQTQVTRVVPKYEEFVAAFPTVEDLAEATTADVLGRWQGLGYNRRGLALLRAARQIVREHDGSVPADMPALLALPGVGPATAAAVSVFAFGKPVPFIETNIRAAFIHHFFPDGSGVPDSELLPLVEATLDLGDPREWYYALMDYGAWLKRHHPNPSRRSRHHTPQSSFVGSRRQLRAAALRAVLQATQPVLPGGDIGGVVASTGIDVSGIDDVLADLVEEGFLVRTGRGYSIT